MTYRALALDPDTCLKRNLEKAHISNITLSTAINAEQLCASVDEEAADLIVLHSELFEGISGLELIARVRKQKPSMPALLLTDKDATEQLYEEAAKNSRIELMPAPITPGKLQYHLARLFEGRQPVPKPLRVSPIEELRNSRSGRLDANEISKVFDLPMSAIAKCLGRVRQTIEKTPDSINSQPGLFQFERIAGGLFKMTGSIKGLKMWLNTPNPVFENHTPLDVIKLGQVEMLADWVDDARLGNPG